MHSALSEDGSLLKPELLLVADELVTNQLVSNINVLKTQLNLYYKGRHFTAGCKAKSTIFWVGILDETKITDSTVKTWAKLGKLSTGTYFNTKYIAVEVEELLVNFIVETGIGA